MAVSFLGRRVLGSKFCGVCVTVIGEKRVRVGGRGGGEAGVSEDMVVYTCFPVLVLVARNMTVRSGFVETHPCK